MSDGWRRYQPMREIFEKWGLLFRSRSYFLVLRKKFFSVIHCTKNALLWREYYLRLCCVGKMLQNHFSTLVIWTFFRAHAMLLSMKTWNFILLFSFLCYHFLITKRLSIVKHENLFFWHLFDFFALRVEVCQNACINKNTLFCLFRFCHRPVLGTKLWLKLYGSSESDGCFSAVKWGNFATMG